MARILYIVTDLPYPPRSGITIASYYHLRGLSRQHEVSLLYIKPHNKRIDPESLDENQRLVKKLFVLDAYPKRKVNMILNEMFLRVPSFAAYQLDKKECCRLFHEADFDVLWGAPIGPTACFPIIEEVLIRNPKRLRIAAISDCYTSLLRSMGSHVVQSKWSFPTRVTNLVKWLRSWGMGHMESNLLSNMDLIFVQTERDREWVSKISRRMLSDRTYILPNGIDKKLLQLPDKNRTGCVGYIGSLYDPKHARSVTWILDCVWPVVKTACPSARFRIIGREGAKQLMQRLQGDDRIAYIPYVEKEQDLYKDISVLICCNYKGIGLINRTIKAMATETVVVGHTGAFNGINGFENGVHGFVASKSNHFTNVIIDLLSNPCKQKRVGTAARELILQHFTWESRYEDLDTVLAKYYGVRTSDNADSIHSAIN